MCSLCVRALCCWRVCVCVCVSECVMYACDLCARVCAVRVRAMTIFIFVCVFFDILLFYFVARCECVCAHCTSVLTVGVRVNESVLSMFCAC